MSTALSRTARFAGNDALITGGSGGIRKATAERIVTEGGRVLITGTKGEKLDTGHFPLEEDAEVIAGNIRQFLGKNVGRTVKDRD